MPVAPAAPVVFVPEEPVVPQEEQVIELPVAVKSSATDTKKTTGKRGRRSLKEITAKAGLVQVLDDEVLFQKQYYSIGEVAGMFREKSIADPLLGNGIRYSAAAEKPQRRPFLPSC